MKDLLVALFALSVLYMHRKPSKELYAALKSPGLNVFYKEIPGLKKTCESFMRGDYDFTELNEPLKEFYLRYKALPSSRLPIANLLSGFVTWFKTDSPPGFTKMEKASASPAFPDWVRNGFIKDVGSQSTLTKKLQVVVKRLGGPENSVGFKDQEQADKAKAKNPELYKEFLHLRREFNDVWKSFMSNFVRKSGRPTASYPDLLEAFRAAKITHGLPTGFEGRVDANGQWYTQEDKLVSPPPQVSMFPTVKMNPNYKDGDEQWYYVAVATDGSLGKYGRTTEAVRKNVQEKFAKVRDFMGKVDGMRKKWLSHVMRYDGSVEAAASVVLELLYQTHARVGGSSTETFGMSVLLVKHYKPDQGGFVLQYAGKDAVATKHVYKAIDPVSKKVVEIVAKMAKGKSPKDPLFTFEVNGRPKKMGPAIVNAMFRKCGAPEGVTVHKLRTYHGTKLFEEQMEKVFAKYKTLKSPQDAMNILNTMAVEVGKALNHVRTTKDGSTKVTPATALSAYIDHSSQIAFFQHYGMPLPRHLQKAGIEGSYRPPHLIWSADKAGQKMQNEPAKKSDEVHKPVKPEMPDTKPVKPVEKKEIEKAEPKEAPKKDKESEEDEVEVDTSLPSLKISQEDIDAIEEEKANDKREDKTRRLLEKQAEKFEYILEYGGDSGHGIYDQKLGPSNLLMDEAFDKDAP